LHCLLVFCFLRQDLHMWLRLAWNSPCNRISILLPLPLGWGCRSAPQHLACVFN
jgi:hypothetical protein